MLLYLVKRAMIYARHLLILEMFVLTYRIKLQLWWCVLTHIDADLSLAFML